MKRPKTEVVGKGYVGRWKDGTLGWFMPKCLTGFKRDREKPAAHDYNRGEKSYLCEISVKQVFDKRGRPIVRIVK